MNQELLLRLILQRRKWLEVKYGCERHALQNLSFEQLLPFKRSKDLFVIPKNKLHHFG